MSSRRFMQGRGNQFLAGAKAGAGVLAAVLQQQQDGLAERFKRLFLGESLAVALGKLRGKCDEPFPIAQDAGGKGRVGCGKI